MSFIKGLQCRECGREYPAQLQAGCEDCFAPLEVAKYFSRESEIPENQDVQSPFCFHMHDTMPGRNEKYRALMI